MSVRTAPRRGMTAAVLLAWCALAGSRAAAQDVQAGNLVLTGAWTKAADQDRRIAHAFVTVRNRGAEADCLLAALSPAARTVEIRIPDPGAAGGTRAVTDGLPVPAGGVVTLEPDGPHLVLRDIQQPLTVGDAIPVTLRFERAGTVTLQLRAHFH